MGSLNGIVGEGQSAKTFRRCLGPGKATKYRCRLKARGSSKVSQPNNHVSLSSQSAAACQVK